MCALAEPSPGPKGEVIAEAGVVVVCRLDCCLRITPVPLRVELAGVRVALWIVVYVPHVHNHAGVFGDGVAQILVFSGDGVGDTENRRGHPA